MDQIDLSHLALNSVLGCVWWIRSSASGRDNTTAESKLSLGFHRWAQKPL